MTLKKFRDLTQNMPEDFELFMAQRKTEFQYGNVNSVEIREVIFRDGKLNAPDKVIVFDEE